MPLSEKAIDRLPIPEPGKLREEPDTMVMGLLVRHRGPSARANESDLERRSRITVSFYWRRHFTR